MLKKWLPFAVFALIFLAVFLWVENSFATSFGECVSQSPRNQGPEGSEDYSLIVSGFIKAQAVCSLRLIDAHNGFFAAIAAFIIAGFTYTLWRATTEQAHLTREALETTERAFVFLDGFNVELTTAADSKVVELEYLPERYRSDPDLYITRFAVQPRWKNGGNTPTKRMTIQINWRGPPLPLPPDYEYRDGKQPFFLAPRAIEPSDVIEIPSAMSLVDNEMHPVRAVAPIILIWGRADYEDVFGKTHFVQWCHRLRFERHDGEKMRAGFIQWGDYNRTDEDN
jgi:hypothetical protein